MKSLFLVKALVATIFILLLLSCSKKNPSPDIITPPASGSGEPGVPYQANAVCNYNQDDAILTSLGWTKSFEDNFDGNLSKWDVWTGGGYNNELQYSQESNMLVTNGVLEITAKKENITGPTTPIDKTPKTFKYTSGKIESKSKFSANSSTPKVKILARIKLAGGYGMTPIFVSYGDRWPTQGQINIFVANGQDPNKYETNYFYGTSANNNIVTNSIGYITANADLSACYHVYEMEWSKTDLTFFLDGKPIEKKTSGGYIPNLFGTSQRLSLSLAVNSDFIFRSQIQTVTLFVDWIKVFTSK